MPLFIYVGTIKTNQDVLWKGIIESLFDDFLRFFYPDDMDQFDLEKGFEFLDKELNVLFRKSNSRRRYADKLVKVYTRGGQAKWILIHIEVQGYSDPDFAKRMFNYYYRIQDKYQQPIAVLVIYTDNRPGFHPKEYIQSYLRTEVRYKFPTYKLLNKTLEDFADKSNPFAVVMETAWYALKEDKLGDEHKAALRIRLIRRLFGLGYTKKRINYLVDFIVASVNFENSEINRKFENEVDIILQKRKQMGIREAILLDAREQRAAKLEQEVKEEFELRKEELLAQEFELWKEELLAQELVQKQKIMILNLRKKGFSNEEIAEIMEVAVNEVIRLAE